MGKDPGLTHDANNAASGWITFDQVEIDLVGRQLFVAGTKVALEPKAFAVLELMARNAGRALARDEILDAVWGHRHVTPGVLNRIITMLRHALGENAQRTQYIHTLHGIGYRFDAATQLHAQRETKTAIEAAPESPTDEREPVIAQSGLDTPTSPVALPSPTRRRRLRLLTLLLAPLLCAIAVWKLWPIMFPADGAASAAVEQSVAVLPLAIATGDAKQQYFADGISENLIGTLSQYEGLKVIGRSSSFRFRDSREGAQAIGAKLGVSHLVEGSVRQQGDTLRISMELNRVSDGSTVWTQKFDRPYKDLFALQDDIALAVASALQVKLLHAMPGAVETGRPSSGNLEAYSAYLRGTSFMAAGDMRKAMEQFSQATQIDPAYAQAWAWLGLRRTVYALGHLQGDAARESYVQAGEEIDTALRLQPNFGQAHAIRANWLRTVNHDWNGALAEFRIALALVPDNDPSHGAYSILLSAMGRVKEAVAERRKYIDGDPLAAYGQMYLADMQISLGRLDAAQESLQKAEELDPTATDLYASERSEIAVLRGDADKAVAEAASINDAHWRDRVLTLALQIGNDRKAADAALQRLTETAGLSKNDFYGIARIYALRADADKTFEWLQRDREHGASAVHTVLFDPILLRFRDDPRFAAYCKQAGLPPPSASEALSIDRIRAMVAAKS